MNFKEALRYISSLEPRGWRLGLDRMQAFAEFAGLGPNLGSTKPKFIHVAGTNGKGSTTAFLQSIMVEAGYRTGAFYSPYVADPRERWQFERRVISDDELVQVVLHLKNLAEKFESSEFGGITEFEFKTAIGFEYWRRMDCEWVAIETGLGGRLDATNIIQPSATAIVSIGLDHTHILGDTLEKIAYEKAGIIKPGIPVVLGNLKSEALQTIQTIASERDAPIYRWGTEIKQHGPWLHFDDVELYFTKVGIPGSIQRQNACLAAVAAYAAGITDTEAIVKGIATAKAPGRFESRIINGFTVILDGAHNGPAAKNLAAELKKKHRGKRIHLVTSMLNGHEPKDFFRELASSAVAAYVSEIDFFRAMPASQLAEALDELGVPTTTYANGSQSLTAALSVATSDDIVVVTGSNYLVGEIIETLDSTKNE